MVRRVGVAGVAVLAACTAILDVPDVSRGHVKCDDGVCVCEARYDHCSSSPTDRCETDLWTSSHHCGVCGHDCLGGECVDGACQPVVVTVFGARSLAAFGGEVYLGVCRDEDVGAESTAFLRLRFDGHEPEPAIKSDVCGELPLSTGGALLWSGSRALGQGALVSTPIPLQEPPPVTTVVDGAMAVGLAATAANVYWRELEFVDAEWKDTGLWMAPLSSGAPTLLVSESVAVAASGDTVYWTSGQGASSGAGVFQRSEATGATVQIAWLPALDLASAAGRLYFWVEESTPASQNGIYSMAVPIPDPAAPPAPTLVVPGVESMGALVADSAGLYWTEDLGGMVRMTDLAGGTPRTLVKGVGFGAAARLSVDDDAVYFLGDAVIGRVAK